MHLRIVKRPNTQLLVGFFLGLSLTAVIQLYEKTSSRHGNIYSFVSSSADIVRSASPELQFKDENSHTLHDDEDMHDIINSRGGAKEQHFEDTRHHHDDDTLAKKLFREVRVLCWILTYPSNLENFPTIGLNVTEGREHLTAKTMKAFKYVYDHHMNDADWFMKADDDTYVIMENLRYFLSDENTQEPVYFGLRFKPHVKQGYASGGGGYVLSKEALRRFGTEGAVDPRLCATDNNSEDVQMGRCLQNLGVHLKPTLDAMQRTRFHCFTPEIMVKGVFSKWYLSYDLEGGKGVSMLEYYPEERDSINFFLREHGCHCVFK